MNHKEFVLNNENIRLFREHTGTQVANYSEKLYTIDTRVNQLVATPDFQGQAAENIKAYFKEVYSLILHSLHTVMSDFYNKTNLYAQQFIDHVDDEENARIPEAGMHEMKNHINFVFSDFDNIADEYNNSIKKVRDIIALDLIDISDLADDFQGVKDYITEKEETIGFLDLNFCNNEIDELERLIVATRNLIQGYKTAHAISNNTKQGIILNANSLWICRKHWSVPINTTKKMPLRYNMQLKARMRLVRRFINGRKGKNGSKQD